MKKLHSQAGFSFIEAVVATALLLMATTGSLLILIGTEQLRGQVLERSRLATIVDNLVTDLQAGMGYAGAMNTQLAQGVLSGQIQIDGHAEGLGSVPCSLGRLGEVQGWIIVSCRSERGALVERILRIPAGVPAPNSLVTEAP